MSDDTFKPIIQENGVIVAGGMKLAEVNAAGNLVFEDRWLHRCQKRGTPDVPVDLCELMDLILQHFGQDGA